MISAHEKQQIIERVTEAKQGHVFEYWSRLSSRQKDSLLEQLKDIDFSLIGKLADEHIKHPKHNKTKIRPAHVIHLPRTRQEEKKRQRAMQAGRKALQKGQVAAFLVAGGQGSRLGFEGPKGCFKISPVKNKTLFQLHAEKILAVQKKFSTVIPWYIMTSESNNKDTIRFFRQNRYFGLKEKNVFFFRQKEMPAIDMKGRLVLERKDRIFTSPDGHGGAITLFKESGALADMKKRGVKYIFYFQVDNALVRMACPLFAGYHILEKADMSTKIVKKTDPEERVGVIAHVNGRIGLVEYSEMSKTEKYARKKNNELVYDAGNIAIHIINTGFVEKLNKAGFSLPFHKAVKNIPTFAGDVQGVKFETFVFDALGYAKKSATVEVKREDEFAPVKNKEGSDSPETAVNLQIDMFGRWLELCGIKMPRDSNNKVQGKIEIAPLYALDPEELKKKIPPDFRFAKGSSVYLG
jgi:UDP-N-acetylglucosamine/UDP-N-acetylgalactosamine diphosphorylase